MLGLAPEKADVSSPLPPMRVVRALKPPAPVTLPAPAPVMVQVLLLLLLVKESVPPPPVIVPARLPPARAKLSSAVPPVSFSKPANARVPAVPALAEVIV